MPKSGNPYGLRIDTKGAISFCDQRGGRRLDERTGQDVAFERDCAPEGESAAGCGAEAAQTRGSGGLLTGLIEQVLGPLLSWPLNWAH